MFASSRHFHLCHGRFQRFYLSLVLHERRLCSTIFTTCTHTHTHTLPGHENDESGKSVAMQHEQRPLTTKTMDTWSSIRGHRSGGWRCQTFGVAAHDHKPGGLFGAQRVRHVHKDIFLLHVVAQFVCAFGSECG